MPDLHHTEPSVTRRLADAGCVAAGDEARALVDLAPDEATLDAWVRRREQGEPLPWIVGTVELCGRRWRIAPGLYVPRPQTEGLVGRAAAALSASAGRRVADLCTGSGAVAACLAAAVPGAHVVGVDVEPAAAACARGNGVASVCGDLGEALRSGVLDVVTAVAPYVPTAQLRLLPADVQRYEPAVALDGGDDGLDVVRGVVSAAARLLRPGGALFVELGGDQDAALRPALEHAGFGAMETWRDDDGDLRGMAARLAA